MCSFVTKVGGGGDLRMRLTFGSFLIFHYIGFTCELLFVALFLRSVCLDVLGESIHLFRNVMFE